MVFLLSQTRTQQQILQANYFLFLRIYLGKHKEAKNILEVSINENKKIFTAQTGL